MRLLEIADTWMFRAKAATELCRYMNSIYLPGSAFMAAEDIDREIMYQADRLMRLKKEGISVNDESAVAGVR